MRVIPLGVSRRWLSPYNNRVGLHIALFRGLRGVHSHCACPIAEPPTRPVVSTASMALLPPRRSDSYWLERPVAAR